MKKLTLLFVLVISFLYFSPSYGAAYAMSVPHVVIGENVWLLDKDNNNKIYLLPATYYAKIDNLDSDYYYITFNGISGKVEKSLVSTVGYHAQAAGTMQELTIDPQYSDFYSITLKSSMDSSLNEFQVPVSEKFIFLGEYPLSEMWYCVRTGDKIGYIKASRTTVPAIAIPAFVPEVDNSGTNDPVITPPDTNKNQNVIRIVIIASVCVVALFLVFLLFRPANKSARKVKYYYDEE